MNPPAMRAISKEDILLVAFYPFQLEGDKGEEEEEEEEKEEETRYKIKRI